MSPHSSGLSGHPPTLHPASKQVGVIMAVHASLSRVEAAHSPLRMRQKKSSLQRVSDPHAVRMFAQNAMHSADPTTVPDMVPPSGDPPPPEPSLLHAAAPKSTNTTAAPRFILPSERPLLRPASENGSKRSPHGLPGDHTPK
jgi:hypothetical protein